MAETTSPQAPRKKVAKKKVAKKAAVKKATAKPAAKKPSVIYLVTTKQDGFRRAGRPWSGTTEVAVNELTKEQLKQLNDDPMFKVEKLGG